MTVREASTSLTPTQTVAGLLPAPTQWTTGGDWYVLPAVARVWSEHSDVLDLLEHLIGTASGTTFETAQSEANADFRVYRPEEPAFADEAYELVVRPDGVSIRSGDRLGIVWAVQSLRQLLPPAIYSSQLETGVVWGTPTCSIKDSPRFHWRGIMLDVARWYQPIEYLYRFVDLASAHKLNVVHLHLTDDQGWRFEVKKYPRLTEVGAWRQESRVGRYFDGEMDATPHGGYYTQSQLRGLVRYADSLGVTLVPEVDVPGHTQAAIAAYPELGNNADEHLDVETTWGIFSHVLNFEQSTIDFFKDVFDELIDVFSGQYIHIGGDECPTVEWASSTRVAELLGERGLTGVRDVEPWILDAISTHLRERGRVPIGWDEILEGASLTDTTAVMGWRAEAGGLEALRLGRDVVMAPDTYLYFDQYQSAQDAAGASEGAGRVITLEQVFNYDPDGGIELSQGSGSLLGVECALWCELLPEQSQIEYMMFPRVAAYADIAWGSRHENNFSAYRQILELHEERLAAFGVARRLSVSAAPDY